MRELAAGDLADRYDTDHHTVTMVCSVQAPSLARLETITVIPVWEAQILAESVECAETPL